MTKTTSPAKKPKRSWFAPRQVYLRTGQDSAYVELSTTLQASVAVGFGLLALWLVSASYGVLSNVLDGGSKASMASQLATTQAKLVEASDDTDKIQTLEVALADARAEIAKAQQVDETTALSAELSETRVQLEELRQQLSESKALEATLQAKLDAQTIAGDTPSDQPGEEASSLHAQMENAFVEIEALEKARDEAEAKTAALNAENSAKDENAARSDSMLAAATEELERLQAELTEVSQERDDREAEHNKAIEELTNILNQEQSAKRNLQRNAEALSNELELLNDEVVDDDELKVKADAQRHAEAIAAELNEAELLATIDDLRAEIGNKTGESKEDVEALKAALALAETEIETILKNTLTRGEEAVVVPTFSAAAPRPEELNEIKRLRVQLADAKGDIIKLKSDVRAAKERLAEQDDTGETTALKPDNSAKLEQQLASTRSRIQQLNKALADAKLREVAIDLALISVVPSPSPPAPR